MDPVEMELNVDTTMKKANFSTWIRTKLVCGGQGVLLHPLKIGIYLKGRFVFPSV